MTKNKSCVSRVLMVLVSLAMMLTLIAPAMAWADEEAATKYTITINPNDSTLKPGKDSDANYGSLVTRFHAYQIFAGTLGEMKNTADEGDPNSGQLADVTWGKGIASDKIGALLTALLSSEITLAGTDGLGVTIPASGTANPWTDKFNTTAADSIGAFAVSENTKLGDLFAQALKLAGYTVGANNEVSAPTGGDIKNTASVIAKVISVLNEYTEGKNNAALARVFAKIVSAKDDEGNFIYLSTANDPLSLPYKASTWNDTDQKWEIDGLDAGYYLVLDVYTSSELEKNVNSDYIIAVFANQEINIKSDDASVDKVIVTGEDTTAKGDSAGIGDTVKFRLIGELAENYASYESYKYVFHDTLSPGLTFDGASSVKVYAVKPAETGETPTIYEITAPDNYYTVKTSDGKTHNACSLEVAFADLKNTGLKGREVTNYGAAPAAGVAETSITLAYGWKVVVEYTATVNPNAVVVDANTNGVLSSDSNTNTVYLEYSNDPKNSDSTGKTTEETVYVYVFGENIDKRNGATDTALAGAGFALTKTVGSTVYYAVFKMEQKTNSNQTVDETTGVDVTTYEYTIVDWITEDQVKSINVGGKTVFTSTGEHWTKPVSGSALNEAVDPTGEPKRFTDTADYYLAVKTVDTDIKTAPDDKKTKNELLVKGLDAGVEYTMIEKCTPTGYDTMDDVTFTITATIADGTTPSAAAAGALTDLKAESASAREDVTFTKGTSGYIQVELDNMPSGFLPGTGGVGTTLFYTGGVVLLALGALHIIRRRKFAN